jgi:GNAT superfamily N-acetyltransferase
MVIIEERCPTPAEYADLRRAVAWNVPDLIACEKALSGTRAAVCAVADGAVVGMGRLVGDGAFYWFIVDVVVEPAHQRRGVGRRLVAALEAIAARDSLSGAVNLVADWDLTAFYEHLGFEDTASVFMLKRL